MNNITSTPVLVSADTLEMLFKAAGSFFRIAYQVKVRGGDSLNEDDCRALRIALKEAAILLGKGPGSPIALWQYEENEL